MTSFVDFDRLIPRMRDLSSPGDIATRLKLALRVSGLAFWQIELPSYEAMWSDESRAMSGVGPDQSVDRILFLSLLHPEDRTWVPEKYDRIIRDRDVNPFETIYRLNRFDTGEERWIQEHAQLILDEAGEPLRILGTTKDITDKRRADQAVIYAVNHDNLTDLLNRRAMRAEFHRAVSSARESHASLSLILLDIDNFKIINDTMGHDAGDDVLIHVARCLTDLVGDAGRVARLGGDEFAIIMTQKANEANAVSLSGHILRRIAVPLRSDEKFVTIRASIGVACFPDHDTQPDELLKNADLALYSAKRESKGSVQVYRRKLRLAVDQRIKLEADIRSALLADEIKPFYQPKIDLRSGAVVGLESLARWKRTTGQPLSLQIFGGAAMDTHLSIEVDRAMMRQVIDDVGRWLSANIPCGTVALNLSSPSLHTNTFLDEVLDTLRRANVTPSQIMIEITETVFLDRAVDEMSLILRRFSDQGIRIALDDFGTGYASLIHLRSLPVDELKIDRSFVEDLEHDPDDAAIVSAVIQLGSNLGIVTVAEGVETEAQAEMLRQWGCDVAQGFLFARPTPSIEVPGLLAAMSRSTPA